MSFLPAVMMSWVQCWTTLALGYCGERGFAGGTTQLPSLTKKNPENLTPELISWVKPSNLAFTLSRYPTAFCKQQG